MELLFGNLGITAGLIFGLAIIAFLFIALREFWCWYWKINEGISILEEIRDKLDGKPKS